MYVKQQKTPKVERCLNLNGSKTGLRDYLNIFDMKYEKTDVSW